MAEQKQYDDMGALWENQSQAGKLYYKGKLRLPDGTEISVVAFPFTTRGGKNGISVREDTKLPEKQEGE